MTVFDENKAIINEKNKAFTETAEKQTENKAQNKKALKVFIPLMIAAGIVGLLLGAGIIYIQENDMEDSLLGLLSGIVFDVSPWAVIISSLAGILATGLLIRKASRRHQAALAGAADGELEEKDIEAIDQILSDGLFVQSIAQILQFMFFGMVMVNLIDYIWITGPALTVVTIIFFMAGIFIEIRQQQMIVDLEKLLNPSKDGSVYDVKFQQKWEESCDEMEKMMIYKSAYKAYRAGVLTCLLLWMVFAMMGMLFGSGILPIVAVSVIWLVMTLAYMAEARKLEKRR